MTRHHLLGLSILTGILLALGWPAIGNFSPLLFVAFVPLLFAEHTATLMGRSFTFHSWIAFVTFNVLTTWWVFSVSEDWGTKIFVLTAAVMVNSLMMTLVFSLFRYTKRHLGERRGYIGLITYWLAFEYFHLNWELTWPWLSLGNGFANQVTWIQWYEYTGVFGGSLWILLTNVLIFAMLKRSYFGAVHFKNNRRRLIVISAVLIAPILASQIIYETYSEKEDAVDIAILQPNVDPYDEKYTTSGEAQVMKMLRLLEEQFGSNVAYVVAPETALSGNIQENDIEQSSTIKVIREFLDRHQNVEFVSGMSSWKVLDENKLTSTARKFQDAEAHYDVYNAALQINHAEAPQVYHKSKLVQGVEMMPFASLLKPLENFALDMGGTIGSLGTQEEASVFTSSIHDINVAPVICYESIYGEYVASYVLKGANLIFIMTNDGWWEDTPGYKQHLAYARLRAIENRRSIARSANTGISCFINQKGDVLQSTEWWKEAVIKGTLNSNDELTVYTKAGDYLARIASFVAVALLVFTFVNSRRSRGSPNL